MKQIKYITFFVISLLFVMTNVKAATITDATYDGNFKVSGTGTNQVQIVVFNPDNVAIYMTTYATTNDTYETTLPEISDITSGTYTIKVADYDGTNVDTKAINISSVQNNNETNPNTGDNIIISFIILIICIVGIFGYILLIKNKKKFTIK